MSKPKFTPDPPPYNASVEQVIEWAMRQFQRAEDWWPRDYEARIKYLERLIGQVPGILPIVDGSYVDFDVAIEGAAFGYVTTYEIDTGLEPIITRDGLYMASGGTGQLQYRSYDLAGAWDWSSNVTQNGDKSFSTNHSTHGRWNSDATILFMVNDDRQQTITLTTPGDIDSGTESYTGGSMGWINGNCFTVNPEGTYIFGHQTTGKVFRNAVSIAFRADQVVSGTGTSWTMSTFSLGWDATHGIVQMEMSPSGDYMAFVYENESNTWELRIYQLASADTLTGMTLLNTVDITSYMFSAAATPVQLQWKWDESEIYVFGVGDGTTEVHLINTGL